MLKAEEEIRAELVPLYAELEELKKASTPSDMSDDLKVNMAKIAMLEWVLGEIG